MHEEEKKLDSARELKSLKPAIAGPIGKAQVFVHTGERLLLTLPISVNPSPAEFARELF